MKKVKIIRFNDDNHAEKLWANGIYLGNMSDIEFVLSNFLDICNKDDYEEIESTSIWICDDFEDYEEDDEMIDDICEWFWNCEKMTDEQVNLIQEKSWEKLHETLF